jgi:hypothetical protein
VCTTPSGSAHERKVAALELAAVVATGAAHLVFEEVLHAKAWFIAAAAIGWTSYVVWRAVRVPRTLAEYGFRREGFVQSAILAGGVLLVGALGIWVLGGGRGVFHPHLLVIMLIYPVWGLVQQFVLQALLARNLARWIGSVMAVAALASALFGLVHLPDLVLVAGTFVLGIVFVPIYLRFRNLWPLGIVHGWLGALVYFWILGRDSWQELTGG